MSDRIFGGAVLILALLMLWATTLIEESFIQDPLGPKGFPYVIATVMALSGIAILLKPDAEPHWPRLIKFAELVGTVCVLIAYGQLLPIGGFVVSTIVATAFLSWRLGASLKQLAMGSVIIALGLYLLFQFVLGINLPRGPWGF